MQAWQFEYNKCLQRYHKQAQRFGFPPERWPLPILSNKIQHPALQIVEISKHLQANKIYPPSNWTKILSFLGWKSARARCTQYQYCMNLLKIIDKYAELIPIKNSKPIAKQTSSSK